MSAWFYAVCLTGRSRHIFVPLNRDAMPNGARALCGRVVNCKADRVAGAEAFPVCRRCTAMGPR